MSIAFFIANFDRVILKSVIWYGYTILQDEPCELSSHVITMLHSDLENSWEHDVLLSNEFARVMEPYFIQLVVDRHGLSIRNQ